MLSVGAVADEAEPRGDAALAQRSKREQNVVGALDAGHPADPADGERVGRDTEHAARLVAAVLLDAHAVAELDPQADDRELLTRSDAEAYEVVAHLGRDGDERRRHPGEPALEQRERVRAQRPEVAAQDVSVKRVDDDRRPRVA